MNWTRFLFLILVIVSWPGLTVEKNGFELTSPLIPIEEILHGGPPKDGIPAIDKPKFVPGYGADYLQDSDRVLGIIHKGEARAYPIRILNWHEIVNDVIGGEPLAITWCPLCGSGVAFKSTIDQKRHSFGVSGLLYNSDVLMYDRETGSLWSQLRGQAVTGPRSGTRLSLVPVQHTRWQDWLTRFPDTRVLSLETGYRRDYSHDPYASYAQSGRLYFPVSQESTAQYHPKEEVLGLKRNGIARAWPFVELDKTGKKVMRDKIGQETVLVYWDSGNRSARITTEAGEALPANRMFWFAWYAFHPETEIYQP